MDSFNLRDYLYNNKLFEESSNIVEKKLSAGLLMYKFIEGEIFVFIAKLGGRKWVDRSENYTIPKGIIDSGESVLMAAKREFEEETGIRPNLDSNLLDLGVVSLTNPLYPKDVKIWAFEGDGDFKNSNTFEEEYPEGSGNFVTSPEIETAKFFHIDEAKTLVHSYQSPIFDRLKEILEDEKQET